MCMYFSGCLLKNRILPVILEPDQILAETDFTGKEHMKKQNPALPLPACTNFSHCDLIHSFSGGKLEIRG